MTTKADAFPAKRFFVEMLTRDIDLEAAILDLLDNCVDGCLRTGPTALATEGKPYAGYYAKITMNKDKFEISDNCGGIEKLLARDYAFKFGRKDKGRDAGLQTVGVYGIGMKRAIFKLGTECIIDSNHSGGGFAVNIDKNWIDDDSDWQLEMEMKASKKPYGTSIQVNTLHESISLIFDRGKDDFSIEFQQKLQKQYSLILDKGFKVVVNNTEVRPKKFQTMFETSAFENERGVAPQIYTTKHEGISVNLVFGLYEKMANETEEEEIEKGIRTKEDAGWTIICNDRVIVDGDKTHITGWGEKPVPQFHSQYLALSGYVQFTASDASKLPVTTTKRGIDLDSTLYATIKEEMKLAAKTFTDFTNSWKGQSPERNQMLSQVKHVDVDKIAVQVPENKWTNVKRATGGKRFTPSLPITPKKRTHSRIQFTKHVDEIAIVRDFICDDPHATPADVGEAAFNYVLEQAGEQ